jgi:anaerobic magnesium-protoporphyrin IX monomethyl ester cyclase
MNVLFLLKNTGMHERLGIMILSAVLKKNNHNAKLIITENLSIDDLIAKVEEYNPGIIAYSIMTGEHGYSIKLNRMLKDHYEFYSVFGGPHPTFTPEMIEKDGVDSICIGEGDISFLKVVNALEVGEGFYDTPNFWFKKKDGTITKNPIGELIDDLDTIPFPDREIMYEAEPTLAKSEKKIFMAMRGCPYKCTYCFNHTYNKMTKGKGMVTRFRTVENILTEIKHVEERYLLESVWIDDDTFLVKPRGWLEEFAERFKKEIGLPLTCNIRGELMNDKNAKLLKEIGVNFVWMGIECGDEEIANKLLKRSIKNNTLLEAARILRENKINFFTQNLVGLPGLPPIF